jgi:hypothetical protein
LPSVSFFGGFARTSPALLGKKTALAPMASGLSFSMSWKQKNDSSPSSGRSRRAASVCATSAKLIWARKPASRSVPPVSSL